MVAAWATPTALAIPRTRLAQAAAETAVPVPSVAAAPSPAPSPAAPAQAPNPAVPAVGKTPNSNKAQAESSSKTSAPQAVTNEAAAGNRDSGAASAAEIEALRAEIAALRADLARVEGERDEPPPPASEPGDNSERARIEADLAAARQRLAALEAAIAGGLDPAAVSESMKAQKDRIQALEGELARLSAAEPAAPPAPPARPASVHDLRVTTANLEQHIAGLEAEVERLRAEQKKQAAARKVRAPRSSLPSTPQLTELLPLEFTAFGDFFYRFVRPEADDFGIGTVELDASLKLTPYVVVSTAIAYAPDRDGFFLPAFVIDCGLFGDGEKFVQQSKLLQKSGVSFGRFDVPFGIAYLEYPSVVNRLVTAPQGVLATHGGWNDMGMQAYALAEHWSALAYVVNGPDLARGNGEYTHSQKAVGGRLSGRAQGTVEVGASGAGVFGDSEQPAAYVGGDLSVTLSRLDVRGEWILKHHHVGKETADTQGIYARAMLDLNPVFLLGRMDSVIFGKEVTDRRFTAGATVEVFPQGEVRAVYEHSLDSDIRMLTLQIVGGSTFQPTGLRR